MMLRIRFGEFLLDERCYVLEREEGPIALRPKAFDLLLHLARHRDRVVLREELVQAVWGATRVGPGSLAGLVNEVRQALGEQGRAGSVIRTVHGRGYQLVAPVVELEAREDGWARERASMPIGDTEVARVIREAIGHVSAIGPAGLIVKVHGEGESGGRGAGGDPGPHGCVGATGRLDELEARCRDAGFDRIRLSVPVEAMATPGRLVGDLVAGLIEARSQREVVMALPLPARAWLESPPREVFAGGHGAPIAGLPGGLSSVAAAFGGCAARTPILLRLDALDRAGASYARDLLRFVRALETAPVLVCVTLSGAGGAGAVSRLLEEDEGFRVLPDSASRSPLPTPARAPSLAPHASRPVSDAARFELDAAREALECWREAWGLEALPDEIEAALIAHLCGDRPLERVRRDGAPHAAREVGAARAAPPGPRAAPSSEVADPPRPGVRRVEPLARTRAVGPGRS